MKKKLEDFSDTEFTDAFGELTDEEKREMRAGPGAEAEFDPALEANIREALRETAGDWREAEEGDVPPLPGAVREGMMNSMTEALREATREEETEESPAPPARRFDGRESSWLAKLLRPGALVGLAGAVAVILIGIFLADRGEPDRPGVNLADSANWLTPGDETGFRAPVFTWKTGNGGAADLRVIDPASGRTVARLDTVFSPVAYENLEQNGLLEAGREYRVVIQAGDTPLAERSFRTADDALAGGPVREEKLDDVIEQCEQLIAGGRPADAWMLWSKLTDAEKKDARMQELKARILDRIS